MIMEQAPQVLDQDKKQFINFIMASQTNSFKLQRLTKTISLRETTRSEYEPKETFKLAAINSISKGVKYHDLSYMSGRDLNKLRKEPEAPKDLVYQSAHSNLTDIRKNYDSVYKEKETRSASISKLKEEKNKLMIIEKELLDNRESGDSEVKALTDNLEKAKSLFIEADIQKKVLLNMQDRLKSDKVVYDQRKFDLEKELRFLKKQKEVIIFDKNDISESGDRSSKVYRKFLNQLKAEREEREQHIKSIQTMIEEKRKINQLNEERNIEMHQIAERAMQDKDDTEVNWEKLYLTNKMLSRLLRTKMDSEMSKFYVVESAFKTIKIATGVSDTEALVYKFLNKEAAYGDLLGKIAENERKIDSLKEEGEYLRKQFKELEAEKEVIDSTKRFTQNVEKQLKKLHEMDTKQENSVIYREKMRSWISKTNKKMNSILGKQFPTNIERNSKSITASFIQYLKALSAELEATKDKKVDENQFNMQGNNFKKIIRIQDQKEDEEEDIEVDETDGINSQRIEFIKNNEKHMKDIRRKFEEKRKIAAENMSPNRKRESTNQETRG